MYINLGSVHAMKWLMGLSFLSIKGFSTFIILIYVPVNASLARVMIPAHLLGLYADEGPFNFPLHSKYFTQFYSNLREIWHV